MIFPTTSLPLYLENNKPILGLASQLASINPTPNPLQLVTETDAYYCNNQNKQKIGDGFTAYNDLAYTICEGSSGGAGISELTLVSGAIDGVNTVFVWSNPPMLVFWNGQLLREGTGYTLAGSTTTFTNPPFTGDDIWAYENTTTLVFSALTLVSGAIDGVNDTFVWSSPPLEVFVEGQLKVDTVGYNLSGNTIIFTAGNIPFSGDNLNAFGNV